MNKVRLFINQQQSCLISSRNCEIFYFEKTPWHKICAGWTNIFQLYCFFCEFYGLKLMRNLSKLRFSTLTKQLGTIFVPVGSIFQTLLLFWEFYDLKFMQNLEITHKFCVQIIGCIVNLQDCLGQVWSCLVLYDPN